MKKVSVKKSSQSMEKNQNIKRGSLKMERYSFKILEKIYKFRNNIKINKRLS